MPFVAIDKVSGERIDIAQIENPRLVLKAGQIACQLCGADMFIKAGSIYRAHFSHYGECNTDYRYHPESSDHRKAKYELVQHLRDNFHEYTTAQFEIEVPIPEIRRVADVLVTFPMGWRVAHEIQLAAITTAELEERTRDYDSAGIDVVWWLGKSADTSLNQIWCCQTFGFSLEVTLSECHL